MDSNAQNRVAIFLLSLNLAFAVDSMWGYIFRNGYYDALVYLRDIGPHLLPGSDTPLPEFYIGVGLIDYWLTVLQAVFANIFDGTAPALSIYAFHFAGQLIPVFIIMYVESCREGHRGTVLSLYLPWTCVMQSIGYGIIMPIYCMIHLWSSTTARAVSPRLGMSIKPRDEPSLLTLPWSFTGGYIVPAILMSLPAFSAPTHQQLVAVWQAFPVWVSTLQYFGGKASWYFLGSRHFLSRTSRIFLIDSRALYNTYCFAFTLAMVSHLITMILIASFSWSPPATYASVFIPYYFRDGAPVANMVEGAQFFFQYDQYAGSLAALIWAVTLRANLNGKSMSLTQLTQIVMAVIGYTVVSGPTGALVMLMWGRDQELLITEDSRAC